jgi:uncharacterized repeat protein (TIGR03803 family)
LKTQIQCLALIALVMAAARLPAQTLQTLCSFNFTNGAYPHAALMLGSDGNFYGTTGGGGITNSTYPSGMGTVFQVTTNGMLTTLVSFNFTDGAYPMATLAQGTDGNFYGTTEEGGIIDSSYPHGGGTVFQVTTNGTLTTLVSFAHTNGASPQAALTLGSDGNFYGTTASGGNISLNGGFGYGTVFRVTTNGTLTTLVSFAHTNGASPQVALTLGNDGNFYGTTASGGSGGWGTVFKVTTNGTLTTLVSFSSQGERLNALTLGNDGNFYGTTEFGGITNSTFIAGMGTVTVLKVAYYGHLTTLVSFNGNNGANPLAGLTLVNGGNFYGTTFEGGSCGLGTVFQVTTNGTLTTVVNFNGTNGALPQAALTLGSDGNFYGTTLISSGSSYGTVFRLLLTNSPIIISQPQPLTVTNGNPATFNVGVGGSLLAYQWVFNETNLLNATNATLTMQHVFPANAGAYTVVVTNAYGSVTSNPAMLTVLPLGITVPPMLASGQFQFSFDTVTGVNYAVQCSTNLTQWFPWVTLGGLGVPLTLIDPNAAGSQQRFYRIILSAQ